MMSSLRKVDEESVGEVDQGVRSVSCSSYAKGGGSASLEKPMNSASSFPQIHTEKPIGAMVTQQRVSKALAAFSVHASHSKGEYEKCLLQEKQSYIPSSSHSASQRMNSSAVRRAKVAASRALELKNRCRPLDLVQYQNRVATYQVWTWFGKPLSISPLQCALKGWINCEKDMIECVCCRCRLKFEPASGLSSAVVVELALAFREKLSTAHRPSCPWLHEQSCPPSFASLMGSISQDHHVEMKNQWQPVMPTARLLKTSFVERLHKFRSLANDLPSIRVNAIREIFEKEPKFPQFLWSIGMRKSVDIRASILSLCGWHLNEEQTKLQCCTTGLGVPLRTFAPEETTYHQEIEKILQAYEHPEPAQQDLSLSKAPRKSHHALPGPFSSSKRSTQRKRSSTLSRRSRSAGDMRAYSFRNAHQHEDESPSLDRQMHANAYKYVSPLGARRYVPFGQSSSRMEATLSFGLRRRSTDTHDFSIGEPISDFSDVLPCKRPSQTSDFSLAAQSKETPSSKNSTPLKNQPKKEENTASLQPNKRARIGQAPSSNHGLELMSNTDPSPSPPVTPGTPATPCEADMISISDWDGDFARTPDGSGSESDAEDVKEMDRFDPLREHRWYCPWTQVTEVDFEYAADEKEEEAESKLEEEEEPGKLPGWRITAKALHADVQLQVNLTLSGRVRLRHQSIKKKYDAQVSADDARQALCRLQQLLPSTQDL